MADEKPTGPSAYDYYNQIFDTHKYKPNRVGRKANVFYADGSDALANRKKLYISFLHEASQTSVFFKAFITAFNESYTPNWSSEAVFGRADKIHNFVQTDRAIALSFTVPAASESEAFENLGKVQNLTQFLYPNYHNIGEAQTISQGPLVRLKVMNLLQNTKNLKRTEGQANFRNLQQKSKYYEQYKSKGPQPQNGQLGFITSMTINHNLESRENGVFEVLNAKTNQTVENTILPKTLEVIVNFTPIHEHALGWDANNKFGSGESEVFPYGVSTFNPREMGSDYEGKSWDQAARAEDRREQVEQLRQNAEARYGGMFGTKGLFGGGGRLARDKRRLEEGKIKNPSKRAYIAGAVAAQESMDKGYSDATGDATGDLDVLTEASQRGQGTYSGD